MRVMSITGSDKPPRGAGARRATKTYEAMRLLLTSAPPPPLLRPSPPTHRPPCACAHTQCSPPLAATHTPQYPRLPHHLHPTQHSGTPFRGTPACSLPLCPCALPAESIRASFRLPTTCTPPSTEAS